jgi:hypothetical protein
LFLLSLGLIYERLPPWPWCQQQRLHSLDSSPICSPDLLIAIHEESLNNFLSNFKSMVHEYIPSF